MNDDELEHKLRAHFQRETAGLEPSPRLWERVMSRIGEQGPPRRSRLATSLRARPLPALGAALALLVLVGGLSSLMVASWFSTPAASPTITDSPVPVPGAPPRAAAPTPTPAPGQPGGTEGARGAAGPAWSTAAFDALLPIVVQERMITSQGNLTLAVADMGQAMGQVAQVAQQLGGFVVASSRQGDESASVTVRVPSERFEEAKEALRAIGARVVSESAQSQDVTEEYVDLEARLRNWGAAEEQYLELITRAANVDETLRVQQQLFSVRGEIERIKGRMQYLERTSSMASITVNLTPARNPGPLVQPGWSAGETGRSALRSLADFGQTVAGAAIWIGVYSPAWLLLGAMVFLLVRRLVRR
ncbi:MAG: DUF4349 domain-containing protein [Chloroflexi bacterium]|nr:DUF4349 domain-containing protein [Chloroflexota bacterium]